jgi:hypothetical protein
MQILDSVMNTITSLNMQVDIVMNTINVWIHKSFVVWWIPLTLNIMQVLDIVMNTINFWTNIPW